VLSFRRFAPVLAVSLAFLIPPGLAAADTGQNAGAAAAGSANSAVHSQRVCAAVPVGYAACDARVVTDANLTPRATKTWGGHGYSPAQLRTAYGLTNDVMTKVAIVDAYANPNAVADLAAYRTAFKIGGKGTLTQYNQTGGLISTVTANVGWGQEEMLDLEMVSAICPSCQIIYVGANSNSFADLGAAVDMAASLHVSVISNSYGAGEFSGEAAYASDYDHPDVAITVSSGDAGYGAQVPAAFKTVTAVGGTTLTLNTNGTRNTETVWSGAGSGCSSYISKPAWQKDTACANRTVADVAAVADPATGVAVYDSYGSHRGNWYVFGGTSVAAPIIGAVYALSTSTAVVPAALAYTNAKSLFDVISGSNGNCGGSLLCTAGSGYDGPTGNGTPNGINSLGAF